MRTGRIVATTILLTIAAAILAVLFASSAWWAIVAVIGIGVCTLLLGLLSKAVNRRGSGKGLKVLVALLAPMLFFLAGAVSWWIGVPQGIKDWAFHADGIAWILTPLLYIVVYGLAIFAPTLGTIAGLYYVAQDNRMNEVWIVSVACIILGFLSGGLNHLVAASTAQM